MVETDLLDQQVVFQKGRLQRVRRWWRGVHPEKGTVVQGLTGWETLEEKDQVVPFGTFVVHEN